MFMIFIPLLIKRFLEGSKFIFSQEATSPPGCQKAEAIAHELNKGGDNAKQRDTRAAIDSKRIDEESTGVEYEWQEGGIYKEESHTALHALLTKNQ